MQIDLSNPQHRVQVVMQLDDLLNSASIELFKESPRTHLGASILGHECKAYVWNVFRWLKEEAFEGKLYRLFNRGHEEEFRIVRWLKAMGCSVHEFADEESKQYRITGSSGHFGGSLDTFVFLPQQFGVTEPLLGEFKTHNQKSFDKLEKSKLQIAKPQHYKQMCTYGRAYDLKFGLYIAVNKNTDEIYFEIVPLDYALADDLFRRADAIVFNQNQPNKIAVNETFYTCKNCAFTDICHKAALPEKNCRSCKFARPVEGAQWFCDHHNAIIPKEYIPQGCQEWSRII